MSAVFEGVSSRVAGLFGAFGRLAGTLSALAEERIDQFNAAWRLEVRRVAVSLALGLMLAFFACTAVTFALIAFLLAFWDTHRVLAAGMVSGVLVILTCTAALLLHRYTHPIRQKQH